jgi:hypothetical protein
MNMDQNLQNLRIEQNEYGSEFTEFKNQQNEYGIRIRRIRELAE